MVNKQIYKKEKENIVTLGKSKTAVDDLGQPDGDTQLK